MIRNKSINILAKLNKKELLRLEKFLLSPFFNSNEKIIKLFRALKKSYPEFNSIQLKRNNIYEAVYGKEKYNDIKFRKLFSDFYKLVRKFLVEITLDEDKKVFDILLLDALQIKSIDDLFELEYRDAINFINRSDFSVTKFLQLHELKWQYVDYSIARGNQNKIAGDVFKRSEYLIFYFLCDMFITLNDIKANERSFNYKPPVNFPQKFIDNLDLNEVYKFIEENDFDSKEIFSLFYYSYLMNKDSRDNLYFFKLKTLFENNVTKLTKTFSMNFVTLLLNYCQEKLRISYQKELEAANVHICDLILKHKIYQMIDGYFTPTLLLRIFFVYLRNGNLDKSRNLLKDYAKLLYPPHIKNMFLLGESYILFEEKKYSEALSTISRIKTKLIIIKIYVRKLIMKLDYELSDFDLNKANIDNFRHFLKNNDQINELIQKELSEFLELYNDLVNLKAPESNDFLLKRIKSKTETINDLLDRRWFEKKIVEISVK